MPANARILASHSRARAHWRRWRRTRGWRATADGRAPGRAARAGSGRVRSRRRAHCGLGVSVDLRALSVRVRFDPCVSDAHLAVVPVAALDAPTSDALEYAARLAPRVLAIHVRTVAVETLEREWLMFGQRSPLVIVDPWPKGRARLATRPGGAGAQPAVEADHRSAAQSARAGPVGLVKARSQAEGVAIAISCSDSDF